jgi:hypothetical protein
LGGLPHLSNLHFDGRGGSFFDCLCFGDVVCAELVEGTCAPRKTAALKNKAIVNANLRDDFNY